jgi:Mg2+ and Co2+ transporter CorA
MRESIEKIASNIDLLRDQVLKPCQSSMHSHMLNIIDQIEKTLSLLRTQLYTEQTSSILLRSIDEPISALVLTELIKDNLDYLRDQITKPSEYDDCMFATICEIQKGNSDLLNLLPSEDEDSY